MRHAKKRHKLGRTASHRKATLAALGSSLIAHKRITTTVAKAKALRTYIEPLITRAKDDSQHNRRQVFRRLQNKQAVTTLFTDIAEQVGDRPGGYTRVIQLGRRAGDGAALALIELVDYNDVQPDGAGGSSKRTRRGGGKGRRRSKSKTDAKAQQAAAADEVEAVDADEVEVDEAQAEAAPEADVTADEAQAKAVPETDVEEASSEEEGQAEADEVEEPAAEAAEAADAKAEEPESDADEDAEKAK